ncbi:MAG: endonuclease MutS2 [Bacillota bacterium]|nr:endonuclease MutS2 [Bacillota bacterium]
MEKGIKTRNLKVLEYDKILKLLSSKAVCAYSQEQILNLVPQVEITECERLLEETDEAFRYMIRHSNPPIAPLSDITASIKRVQIGAVLSCRELLNISHVLRVSRLLKSYMDEKDFSIEFPLLNLVQECILSIDSVEREITRCILSEDEIADDATSELSSIRKKKSSLSNKIRDVLNSMIHSAKYQTALQESLVTIRNDRFVLPVKLEHRNEVQGIIHDSSASGATVFIEPSAVVEINNEIHNLLGMEKDEIEKILSKLSEAVNDYREQIDENYKHVIEADIIFARAKLAYDMNAVKPKLNDKGFINILKGRHPLIDKSKVVPVDVYLGKDFDTLVITGPNTGGKTVTLKTIGLFTLMAQTGLHIPASEGSETSVFSNVFADIGDEQSIEQSLSTFSSHMVNIVNILNEADDNSLVLFDELGAGTDPAEGAALGVAILDYVKMCGAKTAATTHYSEIKLYALSTDRVENAACEFDVATLRPTYKLLIGVPGKSNAFAIASRLGISDYIIEKAKEHLTAENIRFEDLVSELEKNRQEAEEAKAEAQRIKRDAESFRGKAKEEQEKIEKQKEKLTQDAKRESKRIIDEAKKKTDALIKELETALKEQEKSSAKKAADDIRKRLSNDSKHLEDELSEDVLRPKNSTPPKKLILGQTVEVITLGQKATVLTLPDSKGNLIVQAGILKVTTNISSLRALEEENVYKNKVQRSKFSGGVAKSATASIELDVRGQTADEALLNVEKFLDDAVLARLEKVTVIHGKGTGVLRSAIHQLLKTSKAVKEFRLGAYGEGEAGVTVITLK